MTGPEQHQPAMPSFTVVKGQLTEPELAALTAVLVALRHAPDIPHTPSTSTLAGGWKSYWHTVRIPLVPGREAWRSSFRL